MSFSSIPLSMDIQVASTSLVMEVSLTGDSPVRGEVNVILVGLHPVPAGCEAGSCTYLPRGTKCQADEH